MTTNACLPIVQINNTSLPVAIMAPFGNGRNKITKGKDESRASGEGSTP